MKYLKLFESYNVSDVDDILNQIQYFLDSSERNKLIDNNSIKIYIRKSKRYINDKLLDFFDFATIEATETNTGLFTEILRRFEEKYPDKNIFIESVLTDRFANYIRKLGFIEKTPNLENNFYKIKSE